MLPLPCSTLSHICYLCIGPCPDLSVLLLVLYVLLLFLRGPLYAVLAVLFAGWSGVTAARVLSQVSPALQEVQSLIMYPCFLMYGSFALLTVY
jgi:hypothetical protein